MSLQNKVARARAQGDPGLFGFLGKVAKGVLGGAVGLVTGGPIAAVRGAITPFIPRPQQQLAPVIGGARALPGIGSRGGLSKQWASSQRVNLPGFGAPGAGISGTLSYGEGAVGVSATPQEVGEVIQMVRRRSRYAREEGPPGPGYHLNKSDYWLKSGEYVAAQSVWVRNRRRNPLNPRALDRAMGRMTSAKRASKKLSRITIRKACPHG